MIFYPYKNHNYDFFPGKKAKILHWHPNPKANYSGPKQWAPSTNPDPNIYLSFIENPIKSREPDCMAYYSCQKHTSIIRYHSQHDHVRQPYPNTIDSGLEKTPNYPVRTGFNEIPAGEELDHHCQCKDEDEGQGIHDGAGSGPTREEDDGIFAPVERRVQC